MNISFLNEKPFAHFPFKSLRINTLNNDTVTDTINDPDFICFDFGGT